MKLLLWSAKALWRLIISPILLFRWIRKLQWAVILINRDSVRCPGCGGDISLVGRWKCGVCEYVFDGFAYARCPVCQAVPPYVSCQACGVGVRNPSQ